MTAFLIRLVHVGCRELGIDADTRHLLQQELTGKESLKDMSEPELKLVIDNLKDKGFTVKSGRKPQSENGQIRLCHVIWRKLSEAGHTRRPGRAGLNAFIRKSFAKAWGVIPADVDQLTNATEIDDVVQALVSWGKRAKIDFDWGRIGK